MDYRPSAIRQLMLEAHPRPSGRMKSVAFSAATVTAVFVLCEAVLRLGGFKARDETDFRFVVRRMDNDLRCPDVVEDPVLFWKLRPNATFGFDGTPVRSNSLGFRTPEVKREPTEGTCRLLYLGDSTTFGWQVEQRERYSDVLQRMLESVYPRRPFETINLAVPGFSSFQAKRALETVGRHYRPNFVVVSIGINDQQPAQDFPDEEVASRVAKPHHLHRLLCHSRIYQLLRTIVRAGVVRGDGAGTSLRVPPDAYGRNLAAIADLCREIKAEPIILAFARGRRLGDERKAPTANHRELAGQVAEREAVVYVPARSMTELSRMPNSHLFGDVYHPNQAGHIVLAAHLFRAIAKLPSFGALADQTTADTRPTGRPVLRRQAEKAHLRVQAARQHLSEGRVTQSLDHALLAMHGHDDALALAIAAYTRIGAYDDAIQMGLSYAGRTLWTPDACVGLALALRRSGMPESAMEILEHAVLIAPGLEVAQKRLKALKKALHPASSRRRPDSIEEFVQAICWALGEKDYGCADLLSHTAAQRFPEQAVFRYWRGVALMRQGEWRRAYRLLAELSKAHLWHGDARLAAAQCEEKLGHLEGAFLLAKAATTVKPFSWRTHLAAARLAELTWSTADGLRAAHRAIALNPASQEAHAQLQRLQQLQAELQASPAQTKENP